MWRLLNYGLLILFGLSLAKCRRFVEVPGPTTALTSENVYENDATAISVLSGIYEAIAQPSPANGVNIDALSLVCGLSADELTLYGSGANSHQQLAQFYLNKLNSGGTAGGLSLWNDIYSKIYITNVAVENLSTSKNLTPRVKTQLIGEAKFLRAFFYYYLVNLYGGVPLAKSSDYRINSILSRDSVVHVYKQILSDLSDAQGLLSDKFLAADGMSESLERVRPTKWAAAALLARTYLDIKQYDSAIKESSLVLANRSLFSLCQLNDVFLRGSSEAIWQLQPVNVGWNTEDGRIFVLPSSGPTLVGDYPVYLTGDLATSFEPQDLRRRFWIDSVIASGVTYYFPYKYKRGILNMSVTEYLMVLRLGEQYLIRAESEANLNDFSDARNDIDSIRNRANLSSIVANDKNALLSLIQHERETELFTEWGHRWLDLKRTNNIDITMTTVCGEKGSVWNTDLQLYPIPLYEIIQDPNLKQNPGY